MNPFYFGESSRQLFGVYQPARERSQRGVVLCYPWAREYLLAYPTLRLLTQRLADQRWHALRFDYVGTGDSAGSFDDASQQQWVRDIESAVTELQDVAQVREVALIGMRYGATLATMAAKRLRDVTRLVLWDPVTDGKRYLAEIGARDNGRPANDDVQGAVLTPHMRSELEQVSAAVFAPPLPRTLVVSTADRPGEADALAGQLRAAGVDCELETVPELQVWREEWGRGGKGLGVQSVARITTWLA